MTFYQEKLSNPNKHFKHMNGSSPVRNGMQRHSLVSNLSRDELFADDLLYTREERFFFIKLKIFIE